MARPEQSTNLKQQLIDAAVRKSIRETGSPSAEGTGAAYQEILGSTFDLYDRGEIEFNKRGEAIFNLTPRALEYKGPQNPSSNELQRNAIESAFNKLKAAGADPKTTLFDDWRITDDQYSAGFRATQTPEEREKLARSFQSRPSKR